MKYYYTFLMILLLLSSCGDTCIEDLAEENNQGVITEQDSVAENYSLKYYPGSSLQITDGENYRSVEFEKGNKLVFEYRYTFEDNPEIADDEYAETILFEINSDATEFSLTDHELERSNAIFGIACYCLDASFYHIKNGSIKGLKTGTNEWEIDIDIAESTPNRDFTRKISGKFVVAESKN